MRFGRQIAILLTVGLLAPAAAPASQVQLADLEDEVMCTVCGVPLSLAREAPAAKRERALIATLIAQGKSKQQIKDELVSTYGDGVLAIPKASGFDLAVWLVPLALLFTSILALGVTLRTWTLRRSAGDGSERPPRLSDEDADRVSQALREGD